MSIDTRFTPAIRNALLEKMQDVTGRFTPDGGDRVTGDDSNGDRNSTDSVSLSADALRVHASIDTTAGQDIFDAERVAELKLAIATGQFSIDPVRLADKFHRFNINL